MNKRLIIKNVLDGKKPPYVPWHCFFTQEIELKLQRHYNSSDLDAVLGNHFLCLKSTAEIFQPLENERFKDVFGVVWNRSIDKDIGVVENVILKEPTLTSYKFPALDERFLSDIPEKIQARKDCFRIFQIGFSLYERAWSLRGMENLMMDFIENPEFVRELLRAIADFNIAQIRQACIYDIDAVYFGDDWGQQTGLQMGPKIWREFILPELKRMYSAVKSQSKYVFIHSCGKVDELFDDLIDIGLDCFNPFQPEVMDTFALLNRYRGRLTFHGGLSTQRTLPYGSCEDVRNQTNALLEAGQQGSYIFAPAHAVEGDVPLENVLAFIESLHAQKGYQSTLVPESS